MKHIAFIPIVLASLMLLPGCCLWHKPQETAQMEPDPKIKSDPMAKVVADINANNSKVPTLWAHHYYEADVVDDKNSSHHVSGDGVLLYISPISMRLKGSAIVGTIFEIGSNPNLFWLKLGPDAGDTMWWGKYTDFANMNPDETGMPIRPDAVVDVLGIATIEPNLNALPIPTMRFDPYADAYIFAWNGKLPDRWVTLREVWYDRTTKLPTLVLVYDMNGRVTLRAEYNNPKQNVNGRPKLDIRNYRQVEAPGLPKAQWPWIPGNYHLFFPDSGSRFTFTLDEAELRRKEGKDKEGKDIVLPDPRSFRRPSIDNPDVSRVIQIGAPAGQ